MILKRYRIGILMVSIGFLSACTSPNSLRREGETQAMQAFAEAYEREQTVQLLRDVDGCKVDYPEVVMLQIPAGLRGAVYMKAHDIPVFVEKAKLTEGCHRQ